MEQRTYQTLILAGLLHDIGKLLNKPDPHGKPHALYGAEFLDRSAILESLTKRFAADVDVTLLRYLTLRHDPYVASEWHVPEHQPWLRCLRLADALSAGERSQERVYGAAASGIQPLDSLYAGLYLGRPRGDTPLTYRPQLLMPAAAFPSTEALTLTESDYRPLQAAFTAAFETAVAQAADWPALEAWIYALLERYTWAVPSALNRTPRDVSLFDHARTSCAIAAASALYRYSGLPRGQATFLFIKGDLSGVQDYIYTVANVGPGGVAKRLRARSFFITALTEVISHRLRAELIPGWQLPIAAQLLGGGAQFVLLAPNLVAVPEQLARLEYEINAWLWQEFQGDLAVVFGAVEAGQRELAVRAAGERGIGEVLAHLDARVQAAKQQRLGALLQDAAGWRADAFKWEAQAYPHGDCPSCQKLPARAAEEEEDLDRRLCARCAQDRQLSEQIVKARYIAYFQGAHPTAECAEGDPLRRGTLSFFAGAAARHVVVLEDLREVKRLPQPYQLDGFGYQIPEVETPGLVRHFANYVPRFEDETALQQFCTAARACVQGRYDDDATCGILVRPDGTRFAARDYPILQTFGCLSAAAAEQDAGTFGSQFLGVLRADVDNLGLLFARGLGAQRSLSRAAALSRMTDLFFSGWVHHALAESAPEKRYDRIYTVYAGGDDLCLVGPWDVLVDFSHHLAEEFARYVGYNPNVTLSAAITVTKPKYPIASSAAQAGIWLNEYAKGQGRNRLHLFGVTVQWRKLPPLENLAPELAEALKQREQHAELAWDELWPWAELLDTELAHWRVAKTAGQRYPVSTAFAHRLLDYAKRARQWEAEARISTEDMLYLAHLAYDLGRNVIKSDAVSADTKSKLSQLTHLAHRQIMAGMRLPLTYALYRNRERSKER